MKQSAYPAIILVRPQMGENIGAAARAMMNFGFSDLRLVAPRDGWPNSKAHEMSAHAKPIIESTTVYDTLHEAIADREYVVAATARPRDMEINAFTPSEATIKLSDKPSAYLFGPENNGLSNDDIVYANSIVTIPTHPANPSLNIAQSVVILAYEYFRHQNGQQNERTSVSLATAEETEALYQQLEQALEKKDFFRIAHKKPSMQRNLRLLLNKGTFSPQEIQTLRGIIRVLSS